MEWLIISETRQEAFCSEPCFVILERKSIMKKVILFVRDSSMITGTWLDRHGVPGLIWYNEWH